MMNLCNLPPWAIASRHFNRHPQPLEIQGVRQANRLLFERLETLADPGRVAALFHDYMDVTFQLHQWEQETSVARPQEPEKQLSAFSARLDVRLQLPGRSGAQGVGGEPPGPGADLPLRSHRGHPLPKPISATRSTGCKGSARTSAINAQFDVLYEFVQYELRRRLPSTSHLTLYRGITRLRRTPDPRRPGTKALPPASEQPRSPSPLISNGPGNSAPGSCRRRFLSPRSFSRAIFSPRSLLKGEGEVLVIGGEYEVKVLTGG